MASTKAGTALPRHSTALQRPAASRSAQRRPAPVCCSGRPDGEPATTSGTSIPSRRAALISAAAALAAITSPQLAARAEDAAAASEAFPLPAAEAEQLFSGQLSAASAPAAASAEPGPMSAQPQQGTTLQQKSLIDGQGATTVLPTSAASQLTAAQRQVLEYNLRSQRQNGVPPDFPAFVRQGYDMIILADGYQVSPDGLIYKDFVQGSGELPAEGQEVTFDYTAYNETAGVIDSSYRKGEAAKTRIGINGLIPGFELGIKTMLPGGKRRIVVTPELGPPVGPSTFFSAKQYEVFDIELRAVKTCSRRSVGMFSSVVCE